MVQSFRDDDTDVNLSLLGAGVKLRDMATGKLVQAKAPDGKADAWRRQGVPARTEFAAAVAPHSYTVYRIEK